MADLPRRIRRRGPQIDSWREGESAIVGVHCWPDTLAALHFYATENNLRASGAAHILLRQALGLRPITPTQPTTPN